MNGVDRLVGRDSALARLRQALDDALRGRGGVFLVAGEPGIGKTTLLNAFADEAATRSVAVAWGQCWDATVVPAFWPWVQVVRTLSATSSVEADRVQRLFPQLEASRQSENGDRIGDRFDLFDGMLTFLGDVSRESGLLVVLDDLQWADEASLLLLSFVVTHVRTQRVVVVGGFRNAEAGPALEQLCSIVDVLSLGGLAIDGAVDVVEAVAGRRLPKEVVADVVRRSGGNPLFLRELTRLVASRGESLTPVDVLHQLGTVKDVVAQRLRRLSPPCRTMLDIAAVLGAEVRIDVLGAMLGDPDDLVDLLFEACRAGVLVPPADDLGPYTFTHDLFREVVSALLNQATKAQFHLTAARSLERIASRGVPVRSEALAAHFVAAASAGLRPAAKDAVRYSREAAAAATQQLAFEDAVRHLRRAILALSLVEPPQPETHFELLLALGVALDQAGETDAARDSFMQGAEQARGRRDPIGLGRAAVGAHRLGTLSGISRSDVARLLEEAVDGLAEHPSALQARVLASHARSLHHAWDIESVDRARSAANQAAAIARSLDDPATLAFCLLALHDSEWALGSAKRRLAIVAEMTVLAGRAGDTELLAQAQLLKATALMELGDPSALSELDRYCRMATELGHAKGRWGSLSRRATIALVIGSFDDAEALSAEAARLGHEIGEPDTLGVRETQQWELGRFGGGRGDMRPRKHWIPDGTWPPVRAVLLADRGEADAARAALAGFKVAHDRTHGVLRHDGWIPGVVAEAVVVAGTLEQRAEVYEWVQQFAGTHLVYGGCMGYGGAVDHHLGVVAKSLGRHEVAAEHFESAVAMHASLGATAWGVRSRSLLEGTSAPSHSIHHLEGAENRMTNALKRDGDVWRVRFRGHSISVRHVKGILDLSVLLGRPGVEVSALELMGGVDVGGAPGPAIDDQARRAYQVRIRELQQEIEEANDANDWVRGERSEVELDALISQLAGAFGLKGRQRETGGATERARAAVTHRIRAAIRRIGESDPELGRHLLNTVKTGVWCVYRPETGDEWEIHGVADAQ